MRQRLAALADMRRATGVVVSQIVALPLGTTRLGLAIARKGWTDLGRNEVVQAHVEYSVDGGVAWLDLGGVGSVTGEVLDKSGAPITETTLLIRLPRAVIGRPLLARARVRYLGACEGRVDILTDDAPASPAALTEHRSVTYDNDAETSATAATSVTLASFVVADNANRYLITGIASWDTVAGDAVVSTVTFNGSGAGWALIIAVGTAPDSNRSTLWGVTAPAVATGSVVVTMAGTCAEIGVNALSAFDVDQTTPLGTAVSATGDGTSPTVTAGAAVDDLVYDCVYGFGAAPTVGAGQTSRCSQDIGGTKHLASTEPGAASVTMSWSGTLTTWAQTAVALKVAAAGGRTTKNTRAWPLGVEVGMGWRMPV